MTAIAARFVTSARPRTQILRRTGRYGWHETLTEILLLLALCICSVATAVQYPLLFADAFTNL